VLYKRLKVENRLTSESSGNNTDSSMNFVPLMNRQDLLEGYNKIIHGIYSIKPYYQRIRQFLLNYKKLHNRRQTGDFPLLLGFFKSVIILGIVNKGRSEYWKLIIWTVFRRPTLIVDALTLSVYGYHFRSVYGLKNKT
jgi:hypothetical protein